MLEITAVHGQIKVDGALRRNLERGPISNEEEGEKHIYFGIWGT